jgi:hypothetical protein
MTQTQGTPEKAFSLAWTVVRSPTRAADAAKKSESLIPAACVYAGFVLTYLIFFWLKPFDFPDRNAPFPRETQGLWFWFRVMLWQPPLEAAWIALLVGLMEWFRRGTLGVRLVAGVAWTAAPFILMAGYAQNGMPKAAFAAGSAVWLGLFVPLWRAAPATEWRPTAALMLALNAIGVVLLVPMTLALWLGNPGFFTFAQALGGLWMLVAATIAVRRLGDLRLPRAFMAVLLSMFLQIAVAFTLHLLGLVPKEILKALLYA